jgi:predicted nicotinamide N-methyase
MATKHYHGPSLGLGSFFGNSSSDDEKSDGEEETPEELLAKEGDIRDYELIPGLVTIKIREFAFHSHNANFVWKGNEEFASWMLSKSETLKTKRILELACGTGILSIFMKKQGWEVTSSDYNDGVIDRNMTFNVTLNGLAPDSIPHLPYSWGEPFPDSAGSFDVVIANDILIYESTYSLLADSIKQILSRHKFAALAPEDPHAPRFILGHKRRVKANPSFFDIVVTSGMYWRKIANYIYEITLIKAAEST